MKHIASRMVGSSHRKRNVACQDYLLMREDDHRTVLTVSDGHSCALRAAMSSRIACQAFMKSVEDCCDRADLPGLVKNRYDRYVAKHLRLHPLTPWEEEALKNAPDKSVYGATLLGCVLSDEGTLFFQLGDGGITAVKSDGSLFAELPDDPDCYMNMTSSLCYQRDAAIAHTRWMYTEEKAAAVFLYTDGYFFRFSKPWGLLKALLEPDTMEDTLRRVLAKGRNGDDQTLLFAYRQDAVEKAHDAMAKTFHQGELEAEYLTLVRENRELRCYLKQALRTFSSLNSAEEKKRYLEVIRPRKERFDVVIQRLASLEPLFKR